MMCITAYRCPWKPFSDVHPIAVNIDILSFSSCFSLFFYLVKNLFGISMNLSFSKGF